MSAHPALSPHDAPCDDRHDLFASLATSGIEIAGIAYFDPEWRLLALRHIAGGIGSVPTPIRRIVRDALGVDATRLVIAHNHPSGDARPSRHDIAFTRALARALDPLGIALGDHLIVTRDRTTSLRAAGML